jgi:hypothetical protein
MIQLALLPGYARLLGPMAVFVAEDSAALWGQLAPHALRETNSYSRWYTPKLGRWAPTSRQWLAPFFIGLGSRALLDNTISAQLVDQLFGNFLGRAFQELAVAKYLRYILLDQFDLGGEVGF